LNPVVPGARARPAGTRAVFDLPAAVVGARARGWPLVMGILNVTPDSFSDGGRFIDAGRAAEQARALLQQGADIIDVGGESTRPGSQPVDEEQECRRVLPVIDAVRAHSSVPISIDTSKPGVMRRAVAAGADMVNDVRALRDPSALDTVRALGVPVVLMHMQGEPRTMQRSPCYGDVLREVTAFLLERAHACEAAGIPAAHIVLDPGFGFGKNLVHNLTLLKQLQTLADTGYAVLAGLSRKSMIAQMIDRPVQQRVHASVALALAAAARGAALLRVHDVAATVDALRVTARVQAGR
jgi:dihydropteroate synthase